MPNKIYFIPTPGDHYSPKTGSAFATFTSEIVSHHTKSGKYAGIIVAKNTMDGYEYGERIEVEYAKHGNPDRKLKLLDYLIGFASANRPFSGKYYTAAAEILGSKCKSHIIIYNEPAAVSVFKRTCPNAKIHLRLDNDCFSLYTNRQVRKIALQCNTFLCCSEYIKQNVLKFTNQQNIHVLKSGVNIDLFHPKDSSNYQSSPLILTVGRITPQKGIHRLIEAINILKTKKIPCYVKIVGSSGFYANSPLTEYEKQLRSMIINKNLGEYISFVPFQDRNALLKHYSSARIACVPSVWNEPLGLVVSEAMACGLPVVASDRGGIPEWGPEGLILVNPDNPIEIADAIQKLIEDKEHWINLALAARKRALEHSWGNVYERLKEIINL